MLRFAARPRQDHLGVGESVAQLIDGERLQQIIVYAARHQVAIEPHIVDCAGRDDNRARFADFRQRVDIVQRIRGFRQVHEQDVRARRDRQGLDRIPKSTLVDLFRRPAVLDGDRTKHIGSRIVADESGERIAQTRARLEGSVHELFP